MITSKEELKEYLKKDKFALGINKDRPSIFGDEIWKFEIILRKLEYYTNTKKRRIHFLRTYYGVKYHRLSIKYNFQIPINVFEGGLRINHIGTIVVNPKVHIGEWCDIHIGVNIGQDIYGNVPIIGNDVYIGPGAKIFGDIEIGNNTMIGANAVVNKSFADNVVLAGVPAKIVSEKRNPLARADKYNNLNISGDKL